MKEVLVPLSPADLIDRLAALTQDATAGDTSVVQQCEILERTVDRVLPTDQALSALRDALFEAHDDLRTLEADLRRSEALSDFGPGFVALTRCYLETLERRKRIKSDIAAYLGQVRVTSNQAISQET